MHKAAFSSLRASKPVAPDLLNKVLETTSEAYKSLEWYRAALNLAQMRLEFPHDLMLQSFKVQGFLCFRFFLIRAVRRWKRLLITPCRAFISQSSYRSQESELAGMPSTLRHKYACSFFALCDGVQPEGHLAQGAR